MSGIFRFFSSLLAKIAGFAEWLLSVIAEVFKSFWLMLTDSVCWLFEGLLGVATGALDAIDTPFDPATYYGLIPPEVGNMLGVIGVPQGISIIVSALVVRFVLQTIPFVRWGS
ncbi:MAG: DUF2523 family protein [Pyrinomonadaceae bacterium]